MVLLWLSRLDFWGYRKKRIIYYPPLLPEAVESDAYKHRIQNWQQSTQRQYLDLESLFCAFSFTAKFNSTGRLDQQRIFFIELMRTVKILL